MKVVLASVLLLPPVAQDPAARDALNIFLGDVADHRALLECDGHALATAIETWPQNDRIRAERRLRHIKNSHRLLSSDGPAEARCPERWPLSTAIRDGVIGPNSCACHGECPLFSATSVRQYPDSDIYRIVRHSGDYTNPYGTTSPEEFERAVLRRWFRATRWVQVVDWYCGYAWNKTPKWRENLGWLAETLCEYAPVRNPEFQLCTELPSEHSEHVQVQEALEDTIREAGCVPIVVHIQKRRSGFGHGRYLQTEQG